MSRLSSVFPCACSWVLSLVRAALLSGCGGGNYSRRSGIRLLPVIGLTGQKTVARLWNWAVLVFALLLAACGGGSGSGDATVAATAASPVITAQPTSASVVSGSAATFSVTATGDGLAFQWQLSTDSSATWANIVGATAATYSVSAIDATLNGYQYRVLVTGTGGSVTTSAVTLTVDTAPTPPVITVQPSSQSAVAGANAAFAVTATGTSIVYRWQVSTDGTTWSDVPGSTGASFIFSSVGAADNGKRVRVVLTNADGSVDSDGAATLTVTAAPAAPVITIQPVSVNVVVPQEATFFVVASGTPLPTYQWQRSAGGGAYTDIAGGTASSYTIPVTAITDNGTSFRVNITNASGTVVSSTALLNVASTGAAPTFTGDTADDNVLAPDPGVFSARVSGSPSPTYQWQISVDSGRTFSNINGATASSYTTGATTLASDGSYYRLVASNGLGSATGSSAKLTTYNPGVGGLVTSVARDAAGNLYASIVPDTVGFISTFRTAHFYGIRKIDTQGVVTTLAGNTTRGLVNGTGASASFVYPDGMAVDSQGNVFVSDASVSTIRKITPAGVVTTFAGGNTSGGFVDGTGTQASFKNPQGLAIDTADNVYVADTGNSAIRKITPAGVVTTLAGGARATTPIPVDGAGSIATFNDPGGVAVDGAGYVYVADTYYHAIRKIAPSGEVTTLAGGRIQGLLDATGTVAEFSFPGSLAVDGNGVVWVGDDHNHAIRKVTTAGVVTTVTGGTPNDYIPFSIVVDALGNLYTGANYGFAKSPYEIRKLTPSGIVTAIPDCCTGAP